MQYTPQCGQVGSQLCLLSMHWPAGHAKMGQRLLGSLRCVLCDRDTLPNCRSAHQPGFGIVPLSLWFISAKDLNATVLVKIRPSGNQKVHSWCRPHTLARILYTDTGTCFLLTGEGKGFSLAKAQRGMLEPNCIALHDADSNFGMIRCQAQCAVR